MKGYKIGIGENSESVFPVLITLDIPEEYPGLRIIGDSWRFRSNIARVIKIKTINGSNELNSAISCFDWGFDYRPGEIVFPDYFSPSPFLCMGGIHFFTNIDQAYLYTTQNWVLTQILNYGKIMRKVPLSPEPAKSYSMFYWPISRPTQYAILK